LPGRLGMAVGGESVAKLLLHQGSQYGRRVREPLQKPAAMIVV
jgi:hypothetical protein